jgi:hypothetical protein
MINLYGKAGYEEMTAHMKERLAELRRETNDTFETSRWGTAASGVWRRVRAGFGEAAEVTHTAALPSRR